MKANRFIEGIGTPIVQVRSDSDHAPQRGRAELGTGGEAHGDSIVELRSHVVNQQIGVRRNEAARSSQRLDVTTVATDVVKQFFAGGCVANQRVRFRSRHQHGERDDVEQIGLVEFRVSNAIFVFDRLVGSADLLLNNRAGRR